MKREPWELHPELWKTKASFFTYLRGGLRLIWSRYPAKLAWKKLQLTDPPPGYSGRAKKLGRCHYCNNSFAASSLEVDHVSQAGQCTGWDTAAEFLHKLLDCNDNWVLACKPCHKIKSLAERKNVGFEEAMIEKKVIAFVKRPVDEVVAFCIKNGYTKAMLRNAASRRQAVCAIYSKETE